MAWLIFPCNVGKLSEKKPAFANYKCLVICLSKDKLQFRKAKGQRFGAVFRSSYSNPELYTLVKNNFIYSPKS